MLGSGFIGPAPAMANINLVPPQAVILFAERATSLIL
jgi:hypothetical protein